MNQDDDSQILKIERPLFYQEKLQKNLNYEAPEENYLDQLIPNCKNCNPGKFLLNSVPVLKWLPKYKWRTELVNDLIAGFTVAIMHIPQGMAYALLGNVPPVVGIYMAFFPVFIYFLLGTSKHNSMGTFAIVCLMTGKVVIEKSNLHSSIEHNLKNGTSIGDVGNVAHGYDPIQVAVAVTMAVGITQLVMYVLRLGIVSTLLSETLVNGFTTGAAFHVFTSQIKDLFGLKIPKNEGAFTLLYSYYYIGREIVNLNYVATIISIITVTVCIINNEILKPRVAKISAFPIPIELLVVVSGTLVSSYWNFQDNYNVQIVGHIPSGIPPPTLPDFNLISSVFVDGVIIAIVAYTITLSMGMIFAQRLGYDVDANQELLAQGASNVFGSFFSCMPISASLSRSLIQEAVGGRTQLASIVSCSILLFILLWIGPFFEPLPKAVLASVIVVALKGMFTQAVALKKFWRLSKLDAAVWIITFLTTVLVNVDIGLLAGILVSLASILILGMKPYTCLLGNVPGTDLYVDINKYKKAIHVPNVRIFHYCGGINFATRNYFKNDLYKLLNLNPQKVLLKRIKAKKMQIGNGKINKGFQDSSVFEIEDLPESNKVQVIGEYNLFKYLILDLTSLSYIDPSAVATLKATIDDFRKIDISVLIAGCSDHVYDKMKECELFHEKDDIFRVFPTVHDAVQSTKTAANNYVTPL